MARNCYKNDETTVERKSCDEGLDTTVSLTAFVDCTWPPCFPRWFFLSFRFASAIYLAGWLLASYVLFSINNKSSGKWFVFLTNWAFAMLVVQSTCLAALVLKHRMSWFTMIKPRDIEEGQRNVEERKNLSKINSLAKFAWIADNISSTMAIGVTITYWTFLYDGRRTVSIATIHTHGINVVYVLLDVCLMSDRPRHLIHVYQPMLFGVVYVIFSWIYWVLGGTDPHGRHYIYSFLDWTRPMHSLMSLALFAVLSAAVLHVVIWSLHRIRRSCLLQPIISRENLQFEMNT